MQIIRYTVICQIGRSYWSPSLMVIRLGRRKEQIAMTDMLLFHLYIFWD